jgi:FkbM family methyltransferase
MNIETYLSHPIPVQPWLNKFFNNQESLTIFDIGACEGEESIRYAKMFPASTVYSFEPLKNNYQLIKRNFLKFDKEADHLFNIALGDFNGETTFFVSSGQPENLKNTEEWNYGNKSGSILPPGEITTNTYQWLKFEEGEKVVVRRLEDFCKEEKVKHISFIHMDVQGAELKVLEGAGKMLSEIDLVWMEVSVKEFYKGQPLEKEVYNYMQQKGFVLVFQHNEGSYGDHLYASADFFSHRKYQLTNLERMKIWWSNLTGV